MNMPLDITGIVPVLVTPLRDDDTLDEEGFASLARYITSYDFGGVFALSTGGEDQNLSPESLDRLAELLVEHYKGKLPILAKTSSGGLKPTLERTRRLADRGIDVAVILYENKGNTDAHMRRFFEAVADDSPVPIFLYHDAGRGAELSVDIMLDMLKHPNIAGIKAGGTNLGNLIPVCLLGGADGSVLMAGGNQIIVSAALGAAGHTAVPPCAFPELSLSIWRHVQAGDLAAARAAQMRIVSFFRGCPDLGNRESVAEVKAVLEIRGVCGRRVAAPFVSLTDAQVDRVRELADELNLFEP